MSTNKKTLWALWIPGPDDLYPAPSKDVARHMAIKHNATMAEYAERNCTTLSDYMKEAIDANQAQAIKWPYGPASHAQGLQETFSYEDWGLPSPNADRAS